MELRIEAYTPPAPITFNYEEIDRELTERLEVYQTLVYTPDTIKDAKVDRANLNKMSAAIADERKRLKKEFLAPFEEAELRFKALETKIKTASNAIDRQVKDYEEGQKQRKREEIEYIAKRWELQVPVDKIFLPKWLNVTYTIGTISMEIEDWKKKIDSSLSTVRGLPAYAEEAERVYLDTLDLGRAVAEAQRLQRIEDERRQRAEGYARREAERRIDSRKSETDSIQRTALERFTAVAQPAPAEEPAAEEVRQWVAFDAFLSADEARALGAFLKNSGIRYRRHKEE